MVFPSGWHYRKSHVINAQAGAGGHYQVKITVHYGSGTDNDDDIYCTVGGVPHCKTDFGDIRFMGNDGSTELDYWMEEKVDSNNAIFWVEVIDSLESNPVTIYVYYGNADAITTSNGDNTFLLYDHFLGDTLNPSKWIKTAGSAFVADSILTVGGSSQQSNVQSVNTFGPYVAIRGLRKQTHNYWDMWGFGVQNLGGNNIWFYDHGSGEPTRFWLTKAGNNYQINSNWTYLAYKKVDIKWSTSRLSFFEEEVECSNSPITDVVKIPDVPLNVNTFMYLSCTYTDWIVVRKYIYPEPAHSTWGEEELVLITKFLEEYKVIVLTGEVSFKVSKLIQEYLPILSTIIQTICKISQEELNLAGQIIKTIYRTSQEELGLVDEILNAYFIPTIYKVIRLLYRKIAKVKLREGDG